MAPDEASAPGSRGARTRSEVDFGDRYRRWEKASELPLTIAALVFLAVYAYLVLANTRAAEVSWPRILMFGVWAIFALQYLISLMLVRNRGRWFLTHLHELAMAVLPFLRPLLLLRLVKVVAVLHRTVGSALREKVSIYLAGVSVMLVLVASLAVLDAEQNAEGANITSFGDAIWWTCVTMSSVGYGDYYPVTGLGRLIAIGLMIAGVALLGSVTATIASWFVERIVQPQHQVSEPPAAGRGGGAGSHHDDVDPDPGTGSDSAAGPGVGTDPDSGPGRGRADS